MSDAPILWLSAKVGFGMALGAYASYLFISIANSGAKIAGKLIGANLKKWSKKI